MLHRDIQRFGHFEQLVWSQGDRVSLPIRPNQWDIPGVVGWNYAYNHFGENTGRVTYVQNLYDATLDRSYDYDHVGV